MRKILQPKWLVPVIVIVAAAVLAAWPNQANPGVTPATPAPAQGNAPTVVYASVLQPQPIPLTFNIDITDDGLQPSAIKIPRGQKIMLVLRNRGTTEHHFHIIGMEPYDLLWLAKDGAGHDHDHEAEVSAGSGEDGEQDEPDEHDHTLLSYHICTSGICPTETSVHAHAVAGDKDVIIFSTLSTGTFEIKDPVNPRGVIGKVTVY